MKSPPKRKSREPKQPSLWVVEFLEPEKPRHWWPHSLGHASYDKAMAVAVCNELLRRYERYKMSRKCWRVARYIRAARG